MSRVRRVAVVTLVVALVAAGTALAGRYDPRRKLTPADQARAAAMLLRTADLGRGYSPQSRGPLGLRRRQVHGARRVRSDAHRRGRLEPGRPGLAFVVAAARVYASTADADRSWRPSWARPGECAKCAQSAPSGGAPVTSRPDRLSRRSRPARSRSDALHCRHRRRGAVRRRRVALQRGRGQASLRDRHVRRSRRVARARAPARSHPRRPPGEGDARRVTARSGAAGAAAPAPNRVGCPSGRPSGRVQNGP